MFFIFISKFHSSCYLSTAFQLNVGCFSAGLPILAITCTGLAHVYWILWLFDYHCCCFACLYVCLLDCLYHVLFGCYSLLYLVCLRMPYVSLPYFRCVSLAYMRLHSLFILVCLAGCLLFFTVWSNLKWDSLPFTSNTM